MANEVYRVFTVDSGAVSEGAKIETLHLKGANIDIPAVLVGEEGRGRKQEAMPVDRPPMVPCPMRGQEVWRSYGDVAGKCPLCGQAMTNNPADERKMQWNHPDAGSVPGTLMFAEVGTTKAGKPKFFTKGAPTTDDKIVVVFRTKMGFRGGNDHTGDRDGWKCASCGEKGEGEVPKTCPKCGKESGSWSGPERQFAAFPGQKLVSGTIAEGAAGRMGAGEQMIAVMPKGVVFRTSYSGRLYGGPSAHYYVWNGEKLIAATWDERAAADLF
jgi:predicted RNA-binding Zn-ribbon protein involved in translation (DUF1610 family)